MKALIACRLFVAVAAIACASTVHAQYSGLYVFGDSLSDTGNNALVIGADPAQSITSNAYIPIFPYASGQYSNGNVWVHTFANSLGLSPVPSLAGGGIFAFGGAQTSFESPPIPGLGFGFPPSLSTQTSMFLGATGGVAPGDALYVLAGGGNNARAALEAIAGGADPGFIIGAAATQYAADIGGMVDRLQAAGAEDIVVWNTPDIGLAPALGAGAAPASFLGTLLASSMNAMLAGRLAGEAGVHTFDVFGLVNDIVLHPGSYGLANVTDACGAVAGCNPSSYLFWDGIHPTSAGHAILGNAMVTAIPEPETYVLLLAGLLLIAFHARRQRAAA